MIWLLSAMWFFIGVNVGIQIGAGIYRRHLKKSLEICNGYEAICRKAIGQIEDIQETLRSSINSAVSPSETNITK